MCVFLIKLGLLISEQAGSFQALDVAGQGVVGFSSHFSRQPHVCVIRVQLVDLQELPVFDVLDV